jgi:hypothetical protein
MHLRVAMSAEKAGSSSPKKSTPERVCDPCFNRLAFECFQWTQSMARLRKEQAKMEQRMIEERQRILSERNTPPNTGSKRISDNTTAANAAMNETMQAMLERGEKLNQVAEKSEQMNMVRFY